MRLVEYSSNIPEEMIALDELLLTKAETGRIGETLRIWNSREYFVVTGRAKKAQKDCFPDRCRRDGIKIIRRISGGGTVLEGPGCLNYSAVLSYGRDKKYKDIRYSYRRILESFSERFKTKGLDVEFLPVSDLALNGKKISGNAQARKRKYFLHHGTFLFDFNIRKISRYLRYPDREPEYRKGRKHEDFLANIPVTAGKLEEIIREVFSPSSAVWRPEQEDLKELRALTLRKFANNKWNDAF